MSRSRATFLASLAAQKARSPSGCVACSGHECQKQPSTKTASRSLGKRCRPCVGVEVEAALHAEAKPAAVELRANGELGRRAVLACAAHPLADTRRGGNRSAAWPRETRRCGRCRHVSFSPVRVIVSVMYKASRHHC